MKEGKTRSGMRHICKAPEGYELSPPTIVNNKVRIIALPKDGMNPPLEWSLKKKKWEDVVLIIDRTVIT